MVASLAEKNVLRASIPSRVSFASSDTGLTGILRQSYDLRKERFLSLSLSLSPRRGGENVSSFPVIQINVISRLYSRSESRFYVSIFNELYPFYSRNDIPSSVSISLVLCYNSSVVKSWILYTSCK